MSFGIWKKKKKCHYVDLKMIDNFRAFLGVFQILVLFEEWTITFVFHLLILSSIFYSTSTIACSCPPSPTCSPDGQIDFFNNLFFFLVIIYVKFHDNRILFTIRLTNLFFMHNFKHNKDGVYFYNFKLDFIVITNWFQSLIKQNGAVQ